MSGPPARLAAIEHQAERDPHDDADAGGDADRLPGLVMDIGVGRLDRRLGLHDRGLFQLDQLVLGDLQLLLDAFAPHGGLVAARGGRGLQQLLGFGNHHVEILEKFLCHFGCHLGCVGSWRAPSGCAIGNAAFRTATPRHPEFPKTSVAPKRPLRC